MVQAHEIISPPLEFRDDYKPIPTPRTKKPVLKRPVPESRTKIERLNTALKKFSESYTIGIKSYDVPIDSVAKHKISYWSTSQKHNIVTYEGFQIH